MKPPVEIFDEWLASLRPPIGVRFHPIPADIAHYFEDQRAYFLRRMTAIRPMYLPNRSLDIHLDFSDAGICNARADICQNLGIVMICKGVILLPAEIFNMMFSHPDVLPALGGHNEIRGPQHNDGLPINYDELVQRRMSAGRNPTATEPIDVVPQSSSPHVHGDRLVVSGLA